MSKTVKVLIALFSTIIIVSSWGMYTTVSSRLEADQERMLATARDFIEKKIYDKGIAEFIGALKVKTAQNASILYELANVYKDAQSLTEYRNVLQELIDDETAPEGMPLSDIYAEAFEYDYINSRSVSDSLSLLKDGIKKTGATDLINLYEDRRYTVNPRMELYDEAGIIIGGAGLVYQKGLWGYVNEKGNTLIKPGYEIATNFKDYAVVQNNGELYVINKNGKRQALASFTADEVRRFDGTTFSVRLTGENDYVLARWLGGNNTAIEKGAENFEFIGLFSDGIQARKKEGKWALIDRSERKVKLTSDYIYDSVVVDETGRCAVNSAIFIEMNGKYSMIDYAGKEIGQAYDDAKPFFEKNGLAAVKKGDKWGFVNNAGEFIIDCIYEDAGSSSSGLAPVQMNGLWGYITVKGAMAIEPKYDMAKQFVNGCAPVKSTKGWYYIVLAEYE